MRVGVVAGRVVADSGSGWWDVHETSGGRFGPSPREVFDAWPAFVSFAVSACPSGEPVPPGPWQVPSDPRQVIAVGANYAAHAAEVGLPASGAPVIFSKFPSCLVPHASDVVLPSHTVDWEVELVLVIGLEAYRVPAARAWDVVAGVTVGQDLSDRALQASAGAGQLCAAKSFPGAGPVGPFLVTPDALADRDDVALGCAFHGETVQAARSSQMVRSVPELIEAVSGQVRLLPGDLVFTGSPAGSGQGLVPPRFLGAGELTSWVEGVGNLTVRLIAPW